MTPIPKSQFSISPINKGLSLSNTLLIIGTISMILGSTAAPSLGGAGITGDIIALVALTVMEIVLGIDNIIFISIATSKLPQEQQGKARLVGLTLAMGIRILLLCFIAWIVGWVEPLFHLSSFLPERAGSWLRENPEIDGISVRDLILIAGGLFLIRQSVIEIHHHVEGHEEENSGAIKRQSFLSVLIQILLLDIVFSLDSVITAVGMADNIWVMIVAVVIAVLVMMVFSKSISDFVTNHQSIKMLALSFLLLIGVMLLAEGGGTHFNKNYVYFAMVFSLIVELLNLRARAKRKKANLSSTH